MFGENTWLKFIFESTIFKLENIKVCYWAMPKICMGEAITCSHILGNICCVGEAYHIYSGIMSHFL